MDDIRIDGSPSAEINIEKEIDKNPQPDVPKEVLEGLDKTIFFSAAAAKQKTNTVYKKRVEVQMLKIYNLINDAINSGLYVIEGVELTDGEKRFLQTKGFGVAFMGQSNGKNKYKIYWS